jgi:hypothetical protein
MSSGSFPSNAISSVPARRPDRADRQLVSAHFPRAVAMQLKRLAVDDETRIQALLEEAVDDLFAKRGLPRVADITRGEG